MTTSRTSNRKDKAPIALSNHEQRRHRTTAVSILKEHSTDCLGNQDVMARRSDRGRSNLIYTGSIKLDRLIRHLPADSIRDRGCGLEQKSGSMAAIFTCSISPTEDLAKWGRPSMCKNAEKYRAKKNRRIRTRYIARSGPRE